MLRHLMNCTVLLLLAAGIGSPACGAEVQVVPAAVVVSPGASFAERLAAQEIRRYVYLRTASLVPIVEDPARAEGGLIVVGSKDRPVVKGFLDDAALKASVEGLAAEQYLLRSIRHRGQSVVLVVGGDATGTLYAAYRLAEHLGVRFYLDGDVLPDGRIPLSLPALDEVGKPLFDRRGIQPFHDFPEGPDWWNADGYKAILAQLPKLRMNFFGLHTYPEGGVGPEPLTWIGVAGDVGPEGKVKSSYPSRHFTAANGTWGYQAMKTGDYRFGAAALFERDDYGADYMAGMTPWPPTAGGRQRAVRPHGRAAAGELHLRPAVGNQDLPRHRDPAGDPHARAETAASGRQGPQGPGRGAGGLRGHFPADQPDPSAGLLLVLDAGRLDLGRGQPAADRRDAGRFPRGDRSRREDPGSVHPGHLRLGARAAATAGAVRPDAAQVDAHELHQPPGRPHARRARLRRGQRPAEVGHSLDGRRSDPQLPATLGRPDAERRRRRPGLRLHGPDGHPLADADPRPQRLGPGPGRLGPARLDPRGTPRSSTSRLVGRKARWAAKWLPFPTTPSPARSRRPSTRRSATTSAPTGSICPTASTRSHSSSASRTTASPTAGSSACGSRASW